MSIQDRRDMLRLTRAMRLRYGVTDTLYRRELGWYFADVWGLPHWR